MHEWAKTGAKKTGKKGTFSSAQGIPLYSWNNLFPYGESEIGMASSKPFNRVGTTSNIDFILLFW